MYTIERLRGHHAIYIKLHENFIIPDGIIAYNSELKAVLADENETVSVILDIDNFQMTFDDLLQGTKLGLDEEANFAKYPKVNRVILISNKRLLKLSMDGIQKLGLGDNFLLVSSLEEAISKIL